MVFIILISIFFVGALVFFAFFPIKISWFFHVRKTKPKIVREIREKPIPRKNYTMHGYASIDEDSYDDPEL